MPNRNPHEPTNSAERDYQTARAALAGNGVSLSDLNTFRTAATAYAATPDGPAVLAADLAENTNTVVGSILKDVLATTRPRKANASHTTPRGYSLSAHVIAQATAKGFTLDDLIAVVDTPSTVYESRRYPGQVKHTRDGLCVAVDPTSKKVITVFIDREFTERRADQTDADALAYERKRKAQQER